VFIINFQALYIFTFSGLGNNPCSQYNDCHTDSMHLKFTSHVGYDPDYRIISNLCLVPFNVVIVVFLYKMSIPLPSHSSKLHRKPKSHYEPYIAHTISELRKMVDSKAANQSLGCDFTQDTFL